MLISLFTISHTCLKNNYLISHHVSIIFSINEVRYNYVAISLISFGTQGAIPYVCQSHFHPISRVSQTNDQQNFIDHSISNLVPLQSLSIKKKLITLLNWVPAHSLLGWALSYPFKDATLQWNHCFVSLA